MNWVINESFDTDLVERLKTKVKEVLVALFEQYSSFKVVPSAQPSEQTRVAMEIDVDDVDLDTEEFMKVMYKEKHAGQKVVNDKTELDKYLADDCEDDNKSFDILQWWKLNSTKYGALCMIAQDVLAMPVSTVASESAFSTGGRVLDPFRSSLTPKMVETLICTQDWVRASRVPFIIEESLDEISKLDMGKIVPLLLIFWLFICCFC